MNREELISKVGIRLSHLAESSDAKLNNLLVDIRHALRDKSDNATLSHLSERLARRVMLQKEKAASEGAGATAFPAELAGIIKSIKVDRAHRNSLSSLADQLASSQQLPDQLILLRQIFQVLGTATAAPENAPSSGGMLGRLGKKGGKASGQFDILFEKSSRLVQETLQHIDLLHGDTTETRHLREQLDQEPSLDLLGDVIEHVIGLLHRQGTELEEERATTQHFMGELREKLLNVGESLFSVIGDGDESLERAKQLKQDVNSDVMALSAAAEENDLGRLKATLASSLTGLSQKVADYLSVEKESHEKSKDKLEDLTRKMKDMEEETNELRSQIRAKQELALKDSLTGIYNRAGLEQRIVEEFARRKRSQSPLSLVFVDCNKFKQINDTFGHAAGDVVLRKVASTLNERARASDVIARYGGDEFVVLLPDTPLEGGIQFCRDACQEILDAGFNANGQPLEVSISCGVTEVRDDDVPDQTLQRADEGMYEAKKMTGLRVVGVK